MLDLKLSRASLLRPPELAKSSSHASPQFRAEMLWVHLSCAYTHSKMCHTYEVVVSVKVDLTMKSTLGAFAGVEERCGDCIGTVIFESRNETLG